MASSRCQKSNNSFRKDLSHLIKGGLNLFGSLINEKWGKHKMYNSTDQFIEDLDTKQIFEAIANRYYSEKDYKQQIDSIYKDLEKCTENLFAYGETKEQAVMNYITYKRYIVMNVYKLRITSKEDGTLIVK